MLLRVSRGSGGCALRQRLPPNVKRDAAQEAKAIASTEVSDKGTDLKKGEQQRKPLQGGGENEK